MVYKSRLMDAFAPAPAPFPVFADADFLRRVRLGIFTFCTWLISSNKSRRKDDQNQDAQTEALNKNDVTKGKYIGEAVSNTLRRSRCLSRDL